MYHDSQPKSHLAFLSTAGCALIAGIILGAIGLVGIASQFGMLDRLFSADPRTVGAAPLVPTGAAAASASITAAPTGTPTVQVTPTREAAPIFIPTVTPIVTLAPNPVVIPTTAPTPESGGVVSVATPSYVPGDTGPEWQAPRLDAARIAFDGRLDEWQGNGIPLQYPHDDARTWRGPDDLSGTAWLGWNETDLYLAVRVVDDVHVQTQAGWEMYKGDSVELWLDTAPGGAHDVWQFGLSSGDFAGLKPEGVVYIPRRDPALNAQIVVRAQPAPGGYTLEARIPWSVLNAHPQSGQRLGYAIDLSDNDVPGTAQQQKEVSSDPSFRYNQGQTFGHLTLK